MALPVVCNAETTNTIILHFAFIIIIVLKLIAGRRGSSGFRRTPYIPEVTSALLTVFATSVCFNMRQRTFQFKKVTQLSQTDRAEGWDLEATFAVHLRLIGKRVVNTN